MGALVVALLLITGVVLLASSGGSDEAQSTQVNTVTGVIAEVGEDQLILTPADGRAQLTFQLRPEDARRLDLFHLKEHSSRGLSTVVTFEQKGATLYALRADDA